ncbi:MAG TPA: hypothetical protein VGR70_09910 [Stellaceae bacterium]|nr:hypothetical protein [Stellaceae bacterium]
MTALFSQPKAPQIVFPAAPAAPAAPANAGIAEAGADLARQQGSTYGQAATILTSGQGDQSSATVAKKMLLGSM